MTASELLIIAAIGLAGGISGGMLGLGGSIVMIPLLALTLGPNQQLYQASAMIVNVVVAVSSVTRHARAGSVRLDCLRWMLPAAVLAVVAGVLLSNRIPARELQVAFGAFLLYVAGVELWRVVRSSRGERSAEAAPARVAPLTSASVGGATGLVAGLLGVGGGTISVPLLRAVAHLPLRQSIGTSAAVTTFASAVGAIAKNLALPSLRAADGTPLTLSSSLFLAAVLSPTALVGAQIGAALTYRLPLSAVRAAFVVLLAAAGLRMAGLLG